MGDRDLHIESRQFYVLTLSCIKKKKMALEKAINTEIPIRGGIPLRSIVPNFSGGHFFFFALQ